MARLYGFLFSHHVGVGVPINLNLNITGHEFLCALWLAPGLYMWMFQQPSSGWLLETEMVLLLVAHLLVELIQPGSIKDSIWQGIGGIWLFAGLYWWLWVNGPHVWWPLVAEAAVAVLVGWVITERRRPVLEAARAAAERNERDRALAAEIDRFDPFA